MYEKERLGLVANSGHQAEVTSRYDKYFTAPMGKEIFSIERGTVFDTLRSIEYVSKNYDKQVEQITKEEFEAETLYQTLENIWNFYKMNFNFKMDDKGTDQVRSPRRAYADRYRGIDCDCFSASISACLRVLEIPHFLRMSANRYPNRWGHVYVIVPIPNTGKYYTVDPVVDYFNYEEPKYRKFDKYINMPSRVSVLDGIDDGLGRRKLSRWKRRLLGSILGGILGGGIGGILGPIVIDLLWPPRTINNENDVIEISSTDVKQMEVIAKQLIKSNAGHLQQLATLKRRKPDLYVSYANRIHDKILVSKSQSRGLSGTENVTGTEEEATVNEGLDLWDEIKNLGEEIGDLFDFSGDAPAGGAATSPGLLFPIRELKETHPDFKQNMYSNRLQRLKRLLREGFPEEKAVFNSSYWWNEKHDAAAKRIGIWDYSIGGISRESFDLIFGDYDVFVDNPDYEAAIRAAGQKPTVSNETIRIRRGNSIRKANGIARNNNGTAVVKTINPRYELPPVTSSKSSGSALPWAAAGAVLLLNFI